MAIYYFDTSALVKRYINEPGSAWVRQVCNARNARNADNEPLHVLLAGDIAMVEVAAALSILQRRGIILQGTATHAFRQFIAHWDTAYRVSELTLPTIKLATTLALRHPLKAYDAVHLALALEAHTRLLANQLEVIMVSGDQRLLQAAQSEGLDIENPFAYAHLDTPSVPPNPQ